MQATGPLAPGLLVTATGNPFPSWLLGKGLVSQPNKFHTPPPAPRVSSLLLPRASGQVQLRGSNEMIKLPLPLSQQGHNAVYRPSTP